MPMFVLFEEIDKDVYSAPLTVGDDKVDVVDSIVNIVGKCSLQKGGSYFVPGGAKVLASTPNKDTRTFYVKRF